MTSGQPFALRSLQTEPREEGRERMSRSQSCESLCSQNQLGGAGATSDERRAVCVATLADRTKGGGARANEPFAEFRGSLQSEPIAQARRAASHSLSLESRCSQNQMGGAGLKSGKPFALRSLQTKPNERRGSDKRRAVCVAN